MAWVATAAKGENAGNGSSSLAINLTGTTAGSLIVAGGSFWVSGAAPASVTVSDNVNGAYTQAFYTTINAQAGGLWFFKNHAGGDITITLDPAGASSDMWVAAQEFTGNDTATQPSGTPVSSTGTSTTANTSNLAGLDNDVLLVALEAADLNGTVTENAGGQGFTLSNEATTGEQNGSLVYKIITGAPGTVAETWTLGSSTDWVAGIAAFKMAGGGGGGEPSLWAQSLL